jgi:hypothetical protein
MVPPPSNHQCSCLPAVRKPAGVPYSSWLLQQNLGLKEEFECMGWNLVFDKIKVCLYYKINKYKNIFVDVSTFLLFFCVTLSQPWSQASVVLCQPKSETTKVCWCCSHWPINSSIVVLCHPQTQSPILARQLAG